MREKGTGKALGVKLANGREILAPRVVSALGYRVTEDLLRASPAPGVPPPPPPARPLATPQVQGDRGLHRTWARFY